MSPQLSCCYAWQIWMWIKGFYIFTKREMTLTVKLTNGTLVPPPPPQVCWGPDNTWDHAGHQHTFYSPCSTKIFNMWRINIGWFMSRHHCLLPRKTPPWLIEVPPVLRQDYESCIEYQYMQISQESWTTMTPSNEQIQWLIWLYHITFFISAG